MMAIFKPRVIVPIVAAAAVFAAPVHVDPAAHRALTIATWMVLSWILEPVHPAIIGFAGCFFFVAAECAEFDVAFGGFGTETPWVLYGGLMLIAAVRSSGGVSRVAAAVPAAGFASFMTASAGLVLLALAIGMIVDSAVARAVILVLVALVLAEATRTSRSIDTAMPLVMVASYAAAVLGSDGKSPEPSMIWRLATVAVVLAVTSRFVSRVDPTKVDARAEAMSDSRPVLALLALTVAAWLTTRVHGVSPGLVGLAAGIAAAFPGIRPGAKAPMADPIALILAGAALSVPLVLEHTKALGVLEASAGGSVAGYVRHLVAGLFDPRVQGVDGGPVVKLALYQSPALILGAAVSGFGTRHVWRFGAALALAGAVFLFFV